MIFKIFFIAWVVWFGYDMIFSNVDFRIVDQESDKSISDDQLTIGYLIVFEFARILCSAASSFRAAVITTICAMSVLRIYSL